LVRIDTDGAYANIALPHALDRSGLEARDRAFATELVYGVTRMRRALDHLVDRFLLRPVEPPVRAALRLGAHQLHLLGTPAHAAVSATVEVAPPRARGLVNAVLRRVAAEPVPDHVGPGAWPDVATRLSYPDWIVGQLVADLGEDDALGALEVMDDPAAATERADGYVQDVASQLVAELVGAGPGELVADLCAAPGGKATAIAAAGAHVVAGDRREARVGLMRENVERLGQGGSIALLVADGRHPTLRVGAFDRVLVDAPCSGLGSLRRRPDARWRIQPDAVGRLADLQVALVVAAADLVRPGGTLVSSVCTLTRAETLGVDVAVAAARPDLEPLPPPGGSWRPWGRGAILLPQAAGTDGMAVVSYRRR
jgi:16S rRNA (cytosine967-C5)-methyltransferase